MLQTQNVLERTLGYDKDHVSTYRSTCAKGLDFFTRDIYSISFFEATFNFSLVLSRSLFIYNREKVLDFHKIVLNTSGKKYA